ncbi:uncharacterized protein A1O9_07194 [Exophiala aquamarina CBS 119918]|uniref:Phosphatidylglycerol lysyltransferase C-terminal domain-containing protein n=1 Tax=Exophiala aquamarina CBS 119918 TaxID=1182545 RepID=A0A072PA69_9EURO|nr:uncharacterized protein A1O9_07194 [Exophiala aquamarina CBS 119918]KEF57004.1 hypothetical protein A1O9_07194 [Exophiala aquamarina CBS 119918]
MDAAVETVPTAPEPQVLEIIEKSSTTTITVQGPSEPAIQVVEESTVTTIKNAAGSGTSEKKQKNKQNKQKALPIPKASEVPFYQRLGETLLQESQAETVLLPPRPSLISHRSSADKQKAKSAELLSPQTTSSHHRPNSRSRSTSRVRDPDSEDSISTGSLSDMEVKDPKVNTNLKDSLYTLDDFKRLEAINSLIGRYGSVSHMSVRDPSYSFWLNKSCTAAVHFKLLNKVAVLAGDPLCALSAMPSTLEEFERYCRKAGWKTSVIGASSDLMEIAKLKKWPVMRFGTEMVLNPMTNEVLLGKSGKRTVVQCRQLLDSAKGGLSLHIYVPAKGRDPVLEALLTKIYDDWRGDRNTHRDCQAFITVFDMFALANLMTFIYTRAADGQINGFAALRMMANNSYHIDPFIQAVDAPRGTSDLLIFASLAYLHTIGVPYLGIGHEPVAEPDVLYNMPSLVVSATRRIYRHIFGRLPVGGKETFNARWKPDEEQCAGLYLIFIGRKTPSPKHLLAMTHFANISLRNVAKADWKDLKAELAKNIKVPVPDPALAVQGSTNAFLDVMHQRPSMTKSASSPAAM